MCYVKSGRVFNRKYSFPCSVADTTKPWKHDTTKGYHITATQTISGIPVFALGYFSRNYLGFYSYLYYIDQDHYSVFLHTVSMDTVLSPDEQLLSFDALLEILTKRIRDGKLQKILHNIPRHPDWPSDCIRQVPCIHQKAYPEERTSHIQATSGSMPVQSFSAAAPCPASMASPFCMAQPCSLASRRKRVSAGV